MNQNSLVTSGILFKFCLDQVIETKPETVWMYGGKEANDDYGKFTGEEKIDINDQIANFIANLELLPYSNEGGSVRNARTGYLAD